MNIKKISKVITILLLILILGGVLSVLGTGIQKYRQSRALDKLLTDNNLKLEAQKA